MATQQPSNAPDELPESPREETTGPSVLTDDMGGRAPGGDGLAPPVVADPLGGAGRGSIGSNADNSADAAAAIPDNGAHEAALQAIEKPAGGTGHPSSR